MQGIEKSKDESTAICQKEQDNTEWKQYGNLKVRVTFGTADLTELLISYAEGIASLKY